MTDERWRQDGIFFFHNPKAAGVSVKFKLRSQFKQGELCPSIEKDVPAHRANAGDYARFRGFKWYGGHNGRDVYDVVADKHVTVTNFRWPPDRVFSVYNFFRYNAVVDDVFLDEPHLHALAVAKRCSFEDFALSTDERITVYTHNQHYRQLSASLWDLKTPADMRPAFDVLYRMPWFFVVERAQQSADWLRQTLGIEIDEFGKENATNIPPEEKQANRAAFERCYDAIVAYNKYDIALYYAALARMDELYKPSA